MNWLPLLANLSSKSVQIWYKLTASTGQPPYPIKVMMEPPTYSSYMYSMYNTISVFPSHSCQEYAKQVPDNSRLILVLTKRTWVKESVHTALQHKIPVVYSKNWKHTVNLEITFTALSVKCHRSSTCNHRCKLWKNIYSFFC